MNGLNGIGGMGGMPNVNPGQMLNGMEHAATGGLGFAERGFGQGVNALEGGF